MQITIDTQKDSKEEIKKTIEFLQGFVNEDFSPSQSKSSEDGSVFDLFGDDEQNQESKGQYQKSDVEKSAYEKYKEQKKKEEDIPRVETF